MTAMRIDDRWYFAYGSNLDVDQKTLRTGAIRCARRAKLLGYRFAFNKRGSNGNVYANIFPESNSVVWGVVYLCCPDAIHEMDCNEGVSGGHYQHVSVTVVLEDGTDANALTYIAGDHFVCDVGRPKPVYLQKILRGAQHHGLPTDYIEEIERIALDPMVG